MSVFICKQSKNTFVHPKAITAVVLIVSRLHKIHPQARQKEEQMLNELSVYQKQNKTNIKCNVEFFVYQPCQ